MNRNPPTVALPQGRPRATVAGTIALAGVTTLVAATSLAAAPAPQGEPASHPAEERDPDLQPDRTVVADPDPDPDVRRAQELEARAWSYRHLVEERERAAALYREAAELRPADDPMKARNLRDAARMAHYAGDDRQALADAEAAARAALRRGDLMTAGEAYLDAAWLAARRGDAERTERFLDDTRLLATSPHLCREERERLLSRIADRSGRSDAS